MNLIIKYNDETSDNLTEYLDKKYNELDESLSPQLNEVIQIQNSGPTNDYYFLVARRKHFFNIKDEYSLIIYLEKVEL